jgi:hypothetical protein
MAVATTPLTYNSYVTQIATLAVVDTQTVGGIVQGVDQAFNDLIPQMLNYAELRIQRDLDLLNLKTSLPVALTSGTNLLQINADDFVTLQTMSIISNGIGYTLLPTTVEWLQNVYSDTTIAARGRPKYFAMYGGDRNTGGNTSINVLFGPYSDATYSGTVTGTVRMPSLAKNAATPLLASTGATFISNYLPDLLIMASMIYISAFQRNFGRQSDDPAMAQSYESQYQALLRGSTIEEFRKKFESGSWTSYSPTPIANPPR